MEKFLGLFYLLKKDQVCLLLSKKEVLEIKRKAANGEKTKDLAIIFNVSKSTINRIINGTRKTLVNKILNY